MSIPVLSAIGIYSSESRMSEQSHVFVRQTIDGLLAKQRQTSSSNCKIFSIQFVFGVSNCSQPVKIGDFPHFLSALASNNQFIIKLVKMWPGGILHVVVGTLKISLDRLKIKKKEKKHKKEFSRVL